MKRVFLFSDLTEDNAENILSQIFPADIQNRVFAYMPSSGVKYAQDYIAQWKVIANKHDAKFNLIDNSVHSNEEQKKLLESNILLISGGNTFNLLHNLRKSGLDKSIIEFVTKRDFVLAGFSAGAIVLTPTIKICTLPNFDENIVGLENFEGLGIVDFEVFPHYEKDLHENVLSKYQQTTNNHVQAITNEDYVCINLWTSLVQLQ